MVSGQNSKNSNEFWIDENIKVEAFYGVEAPVLKITSFNNLDHFLPGDKVLEFKKWLDSRVEENNNG